MARASVTVGKVDPDTATECPSCGFDSLLNVPYSTLNERGVGSSTIQHCPRCAS